MSEKKKGSRIFLTALIVTIVVAVTLYLIFFDGNRNYRGNYAQQDGFVNINSYYDYLLENEDDRASYYTSKLYQAFNDHIDYFKSGNDEILLSEYLTQEEMNEIVNRGYLAPVLSGAMSGIIFDNPELFYLSFLDLGVSYQESGGFTSNIIEINIYSVSGNFYKTGFNNSLQIEYALSQMEQAREEIYAQMPEGLNDYQKVVYLNDYLVDNVDYDLDYESKDAEDLIHTAYGALVRGVAVCDGYSYAMKYLLNGLGIDCVVGAGYVVNNSGRQEGHMWNYVKLYGNWYGVDVTWNDPTDPFVAFLPEEEVIALKHKYLLVGGDMGTGNGFYSNNRYVQNYIYYFNGGEDYYSYPVPEIETSDFVFPEINNIYNVENDDGSNTIIINASGLKDNYTFAYCYSEDGLSYGDYVVCDNTFTLSDVADSGYYKFRLQTTSGQTILESDQVIEVIIENVIEEPEESPEEEVDVASAGEVYYLEEKVAVC